MAPQDSGAYLETARDNLTFEERYKEVCHWVDKRRRRIDLVNLEWSDIRQMLLIRVSQQYHTFDPAKVVNGKPVEFRKWVNKVITHAICNIWRDRLAQWSRPCIVGKGGCIENMGGDLCRRTPSGKQCSECPAYREWEKRKGSQYAIEQPLPLDVPVENDGGHSGETVPRQEVYNTQSDFVDLAAKKKVLEEELRKRLTKTEWRAYRLMYIKGFSDEETAKAMGFRRKRRKGTKMWDGYSAILAWRHKFQNMAREIVTEMDMAA